MRRVDIQRLLDQGKLVRGDRVLVFRSSGTGQVAFVVGRRVGGAVARNRARRILRAAWRGLVPELRSGNDAVLVAREAIRDAKTQDVMSEMSGLLESHRPRSSRS